MTSPEDSTPEVFQNDASSAPEESLLGNNGEVFDLALKATLVTFAATFVAAVVFYLGGLVASDWQIVSNTGDRFVGQVWCDGTAVSQILSEGIISTRPSHLVYPASTNSSELFWVDESGLHPVLDESGSLIQGVVVGATQGHHLIGGTQIGSNGEVTLTYYLVSENNPGVAYNLISFPRAIGVQIYSGFWEHEGSVYIFLEYTQGYTPDVSYLNHQETLRCVTFIDTPVPQIRYVGKSVSQRSLVIIPLPINYNN